MTSSAPTTNPKYGGRSIVEMMEEHFDALRLGSASDQSRAIGVGDAIAIIRDPYAWAGDPHRSWGKAVHNVWEASDERISKV